MAQLISKILLNHQICHKKLISLIQKRIGYNLIKFLLIENKNKANNNLKLLDKIQNNFQKEAKIILNLNSLFMITLIDFKELNKILINIKIKIFLDNQININH